MPDATERSTSKSLAVCRHVKFVANLRGTLNRNPMMLTGDGSIDHEIGRTIGTYQLEEFPDGFSPYLLGPMMITGYPNASHSVDGAINIFKGRSYRYNRHVEFRSGEQFDLSVECGLQGGRMASAFDIVGEVPLEEASPLEPLVEMWEPDGPGRIHGFFRALWKCGNAGFIAANVDTHYEIDTSAQQPEILHRFVRMHTTVEKLHVHKVQDVLLFRDLNSLSASLNPTVRF